MLFEMTTISLQTTIKKRKEKKSRPLSSERCFLKLAKQILIDASHQSFQLKNLTPNILHEPMLSA